MSRRLYKKLLDAKTAQDEVGTLTPADTAPCTEFGIYTQFSAGAAAGTVLIETAPNENYAGTWATLATINWAAASKCHFTGITDALGALRARISSAVTSGTVTVEVVANQR